MAPLPRVLPSRSLARGWVPLVVAGALLGTLARPGPAGGEDRKPLDFEGVIENAKARVFPSLVFVRPVQEDLSGGEKRRVEVFGSGILVSDDGYVVTNYHVAEKSTEIRCVLEDRRQVDATLVGLDEPTDLALLKLRLEPGEKVVPAELGSSTAVVEGQFVMALGAPYGFERSISLGIVSNAKRHLGESAQHLYNNWIQTDDAINPGNSGGPLVDTQGRVVGINTLGIQAANSLGFSIPIDVVKRVVARLREHGKVRRSTTGLTLRPLVDFQHATVFPGDHGAIVDDVAPGSPAEAAGVLKGDRLLRAGGTPTDAKYREDLPEVRWTLCDLPAGQPTVLAIERGSQVLEVNVTPEPSDLGDDDAFDAPRWHATFQAISRERVPDLAFHRRKGVYVLGVRYPGNAADAGVVEGDIVVAVDRKPLEDLDALRKAYDETVGDGRAKKVALLEVLRDGRRLYLALSFERSPEKQD